MKIIAPILIVVLLAVAGIGFILYNQNLDKDKGLEAGEKKISEQNDKIDNLSEELDAFRKKAREDAEKASALENETRRKEKELTGCIDSLRTLRQSEGEVKTDFQAERDAKKKCGAELEAARGEIATLETDVENKREELAGVKKQLADLLEEKETEQSEWNRRAAQLKNEIESKNRELVEAVERIQALQRSEEAVKKDLQAGRDSMGRAEAELSAARSKIASLEGDMEKKKEALAAFQKQLEDLLEQKEAEQSAWNQRATQLKNEIESKNRELAEALEKIQAIQRSEEIVKSDLEAGKDSMTRLQSDLEAARGKIASLEDGMEKNKGELAAFQKQLADLLEQKEMELSARNERAAQLENEIESKNRELGGARTTIQTLRRSEEALKGDLQAQQGSMGGFQSDLEAARGKIATLETDVKKKREELAAFQKQLSDLLELKDLELDAGNQRAAELEKEVADARAKIRSLEADAARKQEMIDGLEKRISALHKRLGITENESKELKTTYDAFIRDLNKHINEKDAAIENLEEKLTLTFVDRILFDSGKAAINPKGKTFLKKVGNVLKNVNDNMIRVIGHTDNVLISPRYRHKYPSNWELSGVRAATIVRFFQNKCDVDPKLMEAVGRSYHEPVADNETPKGRAMNRRVEIVIAPKIH